MADNHFISFIKKVVPRLLVIAVVLYGFNRIYTEYVWSSDLKKHGTMLDELHAIQDTSDMLYFAESSNFTIGPNDTAKLRISDYIDLSFPSRRIGVINHGAYHAQLFLPLIEQIDTSSSVKTIIVTLNMRTFNQDVIYGEDEAGLQMTARLYQPQPPLLNRLFVSLNHYDNKDAHARDILLWKAWTTDTLKSTVDSITFDPNTIRRWCETTKFPDSNGVENMKLRVLADQSIKAYAFQIDESNPMVQAFDEMVAVAGQKNINLVFNLLAENVEDAQQYVGSNLVWLMRQNRDFLVNRYTERGVLVVDNMELLGSLHFLDRAVFPTEHYDEAGRKAIGQNVANSLKKIIEPK